MIYALLLALLLASCTAHFDVALKCEGKCELDVKRDAEVVQPMK